ncbi:protein mono-ADP-ribosyltransferase PARP15 [Aethina tumida]|uniref:protein mono-ADP-ribosyltransferase PARP15 n=1 Tax=Aethina tumida TaxID=116153 RepID=UPI00214883E3|nr:protein mono-ADP-ribosyltransferase PARP15 [Aethina tumida]
MIFEEVQGYIPKHWYPMDIFNERYKVIPLDPRSEEYTFVYDLVKGSYYTYMEGIFKIQNPLLYTKYCLKKKDYESRGSVSELHLFHDTDSNNAESISCYNFDWRMGKRFKYGPGVYFSAAPNLANKHSCRSNGLFRSMFVADVLIQNSQVADSNIFLPDYGFDTVRSLNGATFVKYFDCEYYPKYFVNYVSVL